MYVSYVRTLMPLVFRADKKLIEVIDYVSDKINQYINKSYSI